MNLSTAYSNKDLPSYIRKVAFYSQKGVMVLTDETEAKDVMLHFITYEKPVICKNNGYSLQIGDVVVSYTGADSPVIETLPITDERLKSAWDHDLYRILLQKTEQVFCMTVK